MSASENTARAWLLACLMTRHDGDKEGLRAFVDGDGFDPMDWGSIHEEFSGEFVSGCGRAWGMECLGRGICDFAFCPPRLNCPSTDSRHRLANEWQGRALRVDLGGAREKHGA